MGNVRFPASPARDGSEYDVYISLCCKMVKTMTGKNNYGHHHIAYNADMGCFVCSKNDKKSAPKKRMAKRKKAQQQKEIAALEEESDDEVNIPNLDSIIEMAAQGSNTMTDNRYQRKDFHFIPCVKQPLIRINLRGYSLWHGTNRYSHCTRCACLFKHTRQADSICPDCVDTRLVFCCAVCGTQVANSYILSTKCAIRDPADEDFSPIRRGDSTQQLLYYCKRHYDIAKRKVQYLDKFALFDYVRRVHDKQNLRGINRIRL